MRNDVEITPELVREHGLKPDEYERARAILEPALVSMAHEKGWITVTDDVAIRALAEQIGEKQEEVVRLAFLAGNDLILTTAPPDWAQGMDYFGILTKLAESDPKLREQLDAAVRRVLRLKDRLGLLEGLPATATSKEAAR